MQCHWLHRNNTEDCILFMAGWGMDQTPFSRIDSSGPDLLVCSDYREITAPDPSLLSGYRRCHLLAWSMGVWVAARLFANCRDRFTTTTALAGTLQPIDDRCGIPVAAFDATIAALTDQGPAFFHASMFDAKEQLQKFLLYAPRRSLSSLREELIHLRSLYLRYGTGQDIYNRKIVTSRDRIFPARNQLRAWGRQNCSTKKWPHFPFYLTDGRPFRLCQDPVDS